MKILHIASFIGNIGDNASHMGLYNILNELISNYEIENIEIRKFYNNYQEQDKQMFDIKFIKYMNTFDLCIIGGGGFLDYWVKDSKTGTTIDIDPSLLCHISTKTILTSIGSNPHKVIPEGNIEKFREFLKNVEKNSNIKIAIRNDGSSLSIKRDIGIEYLENITEILDHGFFYSLVKVDNKLIENKYIAINITDDQILMQSKLRDSIDINLYHKELIKVVEYIVKVRNLHVVFVPHIYSDIKAIANFICLLNDNIIRNYVSVAPCLQGNNGANKLFSVYKNSEYVIATRFHANICSIALGKKTIGLGVLDRVHYLYDSLGIREFSLSINETLSDKVINLLSSDNYNLDMVSKNLNKKINETKEFYLDMFKKDFNEEVRK
ncbi:MAG: polysaccharide pyruvyl transferase family protein [Campylobacterales bacterium]|nr:polysaccharide pyruvyl transferase family protein [Campylobacterales bacterium]